MFCAFDPQQGLFFCPVSEHCPLWMMDAPPPTHADTQREMGGICMLLHVYQNVLFSKFETENWLQFQFPFRTVLAQIWFLLQSQPERHADRHIFGSTYFVHHNLRKEKCWNQWWNQSFCFWLGKGEQHCMNLQTTRRNFLCRLKGTK